MLWIFSEFPGMGCIVDTEEMYRCKERSPPPPYFLTRKNKRPLLTFDVRKLLIYQFSSWSVDFHILTVLIYKPFKVPNWGQDTRTKTIFSFRSKKLLKNIMLSSKRVIGTVLFYECMSWIPHYIPGRKLVLCFSFIAPFISHYHIL